MSNLINIGLSGLTAAQWGMTTTSDNISNANTAGYDVERPVYSESSGRYTNSGYMPSGVSTDTVSRAYSQYLTTELNAAQSSSGALSTYYTNIAQLNNLVGSPTTGISAAVTSFFSGLQNVANDPSTLSTRQSAMSNAQSLVSQINAAGAQYDQLSAGVDTQLSSTTDQVNTYTAQIAKLNQQISSASGQGQQPNQLLDQRDQAVANLAQLVGVKVVQDGTAYNVFMASGPSLVTGTTSYKLGTTTSADPTGELSVVWEGAADGKQNQSQALATSTIINAGGQLGGLVQFRTQALDPAKAQLGAIATSLAASVNAQNQLGVDLNGSAGTALFSMDAPKAFANKSNTGDASLSVAFVDAQQPTSGNYTLSYDGTSYTLTDNATGKMVGASTNLSQPIDGLKFAVASGTMKAGDSFLVQPTSGALDSLRLTTMNGSAIAAGAPVLATASGSNAGSGTITQGAVAAGYSLPSTDTTLTYDAAMGGFTGFPAGTTVSVNGGSPITIAAGTVVPYSPATGGEISVSGPAGSMNGVSFTVSGTPSNGDTFTISSNGIAQGDGRNATLMSNLASAKKLGGGSATLTGAYSNYVNQVGNTTSEINALSTQQASLVTHITSSQQSVSGVNINEEAANLLQYQQMYQANAKVIQTADSLFQTILGLFQ